MMQPTLTMLSPPIQREVWKFRVECDGLGPDEGPDLRNVKGLRVECGHCRESLLGQSKAWDMDGYVSEGAGPGMRRQRRASGGWLAV
jgi:hypothetical protein